MSSQFKSVSPLPLFDSIENIHLQHDFSYLQPGYQLKDIRIAIEFLKSYRGSQGTFNGYRREIERLIHWCALISKTTLKKLKRNDIEDYLQFALKPPREWIGKSKPPRFVVKEGKRVPNSHWRPFIVTVSKTKHRQGETPKIKDFELTHGSLKELFAILSSFFNYLLQEEYVFMNPVALIRQKSKYLRKTQGQAKIRRLS